MIDEMDRRIVSLLQQDARLPNAEIARRVGMAPSATLERLRKLEERGVIRGFTAILDPKLLGRDVTAFIAVGIDGSKFYPDFVDKARDHPEIMECHAVTGQGSHLIKIRTRDTSTLERLLAEIQSWPGVHWTTTSIVLSSLKESTRLTVPPEAFTEE